MRRDARFHVVLAVLLVLAIGPALFASPQPADAATDADTDEPVETVTTVLQPGLNLAGWTEAATGVEAIFDAIPELDLVYGWDAAYQRFRWAAREESGAPGDLETLRPGMGLALFITGEASVTWTRPVVAASATASLRAGWNLVVWAGEDGAAATAALRDLDDILKHSADATGADPTPLSRGSAFWLNVSAPRVWNQPYEPPRREDTAADFPHIEFVTPVSSDREEEVRALISDVVDFFYQRAGVRVPGVTIRWGDPRHGCSGKYLNFQISMSDCLDVFPHEYVHAVQDHLEGGGPYAPLWFDEGSADYWRDVYNDHVGNRVYTDNLRESVIPTARREAFVSFVGHSYDSYHLRVLFLEREAGAGSTFRFYKALSKAETWDEAFHEGFGLNVAEFTLGFAEYAVSLPSLAESCPLALIQREKTSSSEPKEVCSRITGIVTDLVGNPRKNVRVSATMIPRTSWQEFSAYSVSDRDGSFAFTVQDGSYRLMLSSPIGWYWGEEYYGGSTGFVTDLGEATPLHAVGSDISGITVSSGLIKGIALGADERPLSEIGIVFRQKEPRSIPQHLLTKTGGQWSRSFGEFARLVSPGTYELTVQCPDGSSGWYGGESGFVRSQAEATPVVIDTADVTDIVINLPFTEEESGQKSCAAAASE